jgi:hypothetical protein
VDDFKSKLHQRYADLKWKLRKYFYAKAVITV